MLKSVGQKKEKHFILGEREYVETTLPTERPELTFLTYSSKFMKCLLCESCTTNQGDVVNHVGRPAGV